MQFLLIVQVIQAFIQLNSFISNQTNTYFVQTKLIYDNGYHITVKFDKSSRIKTAYR